MSYKKQIFKLSELKKFLNEENSCVSLVACTKILELPPFFLNDMKSGISYILNSMLKKYDRTLDGILIGYQNVKVLLDENTGIIPMGAAETEVNVSLEFYIFQPKIGSYLEGVVNKKSNNHIGCLVHNYFNASILKQENVKDENWVCKELKVDDKIVFRVKDLDFTSLLPYIEGTIDEGSVKNVITCRNSQNCGNGDNQSDVNEMKLQTKTSVKVDDFVKTLDNNKVIYSNKLGVNTLATNVDDKWSEMTDCSNSFGTPKKNKNKEREKIKDREEMKDDIIQNGLDRLFCLNEEHRNKETEEEEKKIVEEGKKKQKRKKKRKRNEVEEEEEEETEKDEVPNQKKIKRRRSTSSSQLDDTVENLVKKYVNGVLLDEKKKKELEEEEDVCDSLERSHLENVSEKDNNMFCSTQIGLVGGTIKMDMSFCSPILMETASEGNNFKKLKSNELAKQVLGVKITENDRPRKTETETPLRKSGNGSVDPIFVDVIKNLKEDKSLFSDSGESSSGRKGAGNGADSGIGKDFASEEERPMPTVEKMLEEQMKRLRRESESSEGSEGRRKVDGMSRIGRQKQVFVVGAGGKDGWSELPGKEVRSSEERVKEKTKKHKSESGIISIKKPKVNKKQGEDEEVERKETKTKKENRIESKSPEKGELSEKEKTFELTECIGGKETEDEQPQNKNNGNSLEITRVTEIKEKKHTGKIKEERRKKLLEETSGSKDSLKDKKRSKMDEEIYTKIEKDLRRKLEKNRKKKAKEERKTHKEEKEMSAIFKSTAIDRYSLEEEENKEKKKELEQSKTIKEQKDQGKAKQISEAFEAAAVDRYNLDQDEKEELERVLNEEYNKELEQRKAKEERKKQKRERKMLATFKAAAIGRYSLGQDEKEELKKLVDEEEKKELEQRKAKEERKKQRKKSKMNGRTKTTFEDRNSLRQENEEEINIKLVEDMKRLIEKERGIRREAKEERKKKKKENSSITSEEVLKVKEGKNILREETENNISKLAFVERSNFKKEQGGEIKKVVEKRDIKRKAEEEKLEKTKETNLSVSTEEMLKLENKGRNGSRQEEEEISSNFIAEVEGLIEEKEIKKKRKEDRKRKRKEYSSVTIEEVLKVKDESRHSLRGEENIVLNRVSNKAEEKSEIKLEDKNSHAEEEKTNEGGKTETPVSKRKKEKMAGTKKGKIIGNLTKLEEWLGWKERETKAMNEESKDTNKDEKSMGVLNQYRVRTANADEEKEKSKVEVKNTEKHQKLKIEKAKEQKPKNKKKESKKDENEENEEKKGGINLSSLLYEKLLKEAKSLINMSSEEKVSGRKRKASAEVTAGKGEESKRQKREMEGSMEKTKKSTEKVFGEKVSTEKREESKRAKTEGNGKRTNETGEEKFPGGNSRAEVSGEKKVGKKEESERWKTETEGGRTKCENSSERDSLLNSLLLNQKKFFKIR